MEYFGILGLAALVWCFSLNKKVRRLEKFVREENGGSSEMLDLRKILQDAAGKRVRMSFYDEDVWMDFTGRDCLVEDVDDSWVLIKANEGKKNEVQKLIRISSVKGVVVRQEA